MWPWLPHKTISACSSDSSDGLIDHGHSVGAVLEVNTLPLVVHVVHVVDVSVDDRRQLVYHEEDGDGGED